MPPRFLLGARPGAGLLSPECSTTDSADVRPTCSGEITLDSLGRKQYEKQWMSGGEEAVAATRVRHLITHYSMQRRCGTAPLEGPLTSALSTELSLTLLRCGAETTAGGAGSQGCRLPGTSGHAGVRDGCARRRAALHGRHPGAEHHAAAAQARGAARGMAGTTVRCKDSLARRHAVARLLPIIFAWSARPGVEVAPTLTADGGVRQDPVADRRACGKHQRKRAGGHTSGSRRGILRCLSAGGV